MIGDITGEAKNFDGAFLVFETDVALNLRDAFHSDALGGPYQTASYSNPQMDRMLDQVRAARSRAEARPIWSRIQRMLRDDQPWTFLWYSPDLFVIRERVKGADMDLRGTFVNLQNWWLADAPDRN